MPASNANGTIGNVAHCEEWTKEERTEIVEETNRILADPAFKNSKRCLALFRYLVDRSLTGDHEGVKERTLGVEVFGRAPNYDTAIDPVVRMAANEIRKRLAQWYQEPTHHQLVRVRLNAGTYLLNFEFVHPEMLPELLERKIEVEAPGPIALPEAETQSLHPASTQPALEYDIHNKEVTPSLVASVRPRTKLIWGAASIVVVALTAALAWHYYDVFYSGDYLVWKPLLNSDQSITLSTSDDPPMMNTNGTANWQLIADAIDNRVAPAGMNPQNDATTTPMADAEVSQCVSSWLAMHGQKSLLRGSSAVTLRDLRQGPVVLIGGFNPWSLILLSNLRYSIRVDRTTHAMWIQDAQNISKRDWMINGDGQPKDVDYAVISRFIDTETGNWILSLGGLRQQGTEAASDLLIDSSYAQLLPKQLKSKGNFQIVIKTSIINGSADPPQIIAFHTW